MPSAPDRPASATPGVEEAAGAQVDWRRNLVALWFAEFTAIFGFSFVFPFLPVFIRTELHVPSLGQVSLWAGIAGGATGFALAFASPLWGVLADRYGRKPMLLRAMIAGAVLVATMGFSRNVVDLTILRFLQGGLTGTVAMATALVAAETPRPKVGWALGVLSSAVALGGALGPPLGGIAAGFTSLRHTFVGGGTLLLLSTIPVFVMVRESRLPAPSEGKSAAPRWPPGAGHAIVVILIGQGLMQFGYTAAQQLVVVRLLKLVPAHVSIVTGMALGLAGLATGGAAITYSVVAQRLGYRRTVVLAALALAATIAAMAISPLTAEVVAAIAVFGLLYGVLSPAMSSMLGLEAPRGAQARVFGLSASAIAIGLAVGPITCGAVGAAFSPAAGLFVAAGSAAVLALVMATASREPAR